MISTAPRGVDAIAYQCSIDRITGTCDSRPIIKLVWCPDEFRWMPHKLSDEPPGYIFPSFCAARDKDGEFRAPDRWALMDRLEWPQYGPTWEAIRYKRHKGDVWDLKGPCPSEKYAELKCHTYHSGKCCPCIGDECACEDHCWGTYVEPNEHLLDWIRKNVRLSEQDSDVDPFADVRFFEAPHAQQQLVSDFKTAWAKDAEDVAKFDSEAIDLFLRQPHTVSGMKRTESGLYLP